MLFSVKLEFWFFSTSDFQLFTFGIHIITFLREVSNLVSLTPLVFSCLLVYSHELALDTVAKPHGKTAGDRHRGPFLQFTFATYFFSSASTHILTVY